MRRGRIGFHLLALAITLGSTAHAASVNVATWTTSAGSTAGGPLTATGSLNGNAVTLATVAVGPDSVLTFFEDWRSTPATSAYVTSQNPLSGNTGVAIGVDTVTSTETVSRYGRHEPGPAH